MDLYALILHALPYGLGLSVLFTLGFLSAIFYNPEIMLNDYPPDVKAVYGPARNPNSRRQTLWFAAFLLLAALVVLAAALFNLPHPASFGEGYFYALVTLWTGMMTFNLIDLLLIDIPLVYFQPKQMILPGTEGMRGYLDYGMHVRGFIKGTIGITITSIVLAFIPAGLWLL